MTNADLAAFHAMINDYRTTKRKNLLTVSIARTEQADRWAKRMANLRRLVHSDNFGLAENIASGQRSVDQVFAAWLNSPSHRRNMLGPYTSFGLGCAAAADRRRTLYWCLQLE